MIQVAILGTEGTGKTVLMAMLSEAFKHDRNGMRMIPATGETARHVAEVRACLAKQEWPPSTPDGVNRELRWRLQIDGLPECDLRFLEFSGQDFRRLFAEEEINQFESLSGPRRQLADFMRATDVAAFLINLRDFRGEADLVTREMSQWAIKYALDWLHLDSSIRKCALVLTQADQYVGLKDQYGGWSKVVERYLPHVYNAHIRTKRVPLCAISAISRTDVVIDENGEPRRVPAKSLHASGLPRLVNWISRSAREVEAAKASQPETDVNVGAAAGATQSPEEPGSPVLGAFIKVGWWIVILLMYVVYRVLTDGGASSRSGSLLHPRDTPSAPVSAMRHDAHSTLKWTSFGRDGTSPTAILS